MATSAELEYLRRQNARAKTRQGQGVTAVNTGDADTNELSWTSLASETMPSEYSSLEDDVANANSNSTSWAQEATKTNFGADYDFAWQPLGEDTTNALAEAADDNAIVKALGTWNDLQDNVLYGVSGWVEGITDAVITGAGLLGSLFGADTQWAEDATSFDWSEWLVENVYQNINPTDLVSRALTGNNLSTYSYLNDVDWGENIRSGAEMAGNIVPQVVVGIATGGASVGTQIAIQGATAVAQGASTFGRTVQEDLNNGATFESASKDGLLQAGIETGLNLIFNYSKVGSVTSSVKNAVATNVGSKFASETTQALATQATRVALNALGEGAEEAIETALDPVFKEWSGVDTDAISEAYGDSEALASTMSNIGISFLAGAALSAVTEGGIEVANIASSGGRDYYVANVYSQDANSIKNEIKSEIVDFNEKASQYTNYTEEGLADMRSRLDSNAIVDPAQRQELQDTIRTYEAKLQEKTKLETEKNATLNELLTEYENTVEKAANAYERGYNNSTRPATEQDTGSNVEYRALKKAEVLSLRREAGLEYDNQAEYDLGGGNKLKWTDFDNGKATITSNGESVDIEIDTKKGVIALAKSTGELSELANSMDENGLPQADIELPQSETADLVQGVAVGETEEGSSLIVTDRAINKAKENGIDLNEVSDAISDVGDADVYVTGEKTSKAIFDNDNGGIIVTYQKSADGDLRVTNVVRATEENRARVTGSGEQQVKNMNPEKYGIYLSQYAQGKIEDASTTVQKIIAEYTQSRVYSKTETREAVGGLRDVIIGTLKSTGADVKVVNSLETVINESVGRLNSNSNVAEVSLEITDKIMDSIEVRFKSGDVKGDYVSLKTALGEDVYNMYRNQIRDALEDFAINGGKSTQFDKMVKAVNGLRQQLADWKNFGGEVIKTIKKVEQFKKGFRNSQNPSAFSDIQITMDGMTASLVEGLPTLSNKYGFSGTATNTYFRKVAQFYNADNPDLFDLAIQYDEHIGEIIQYFSENDLSGRSLNVEEMQMYREYMGFIEQSIEDYRTNAYQQRRAKFEEITNSLKVKGQALNSKLITKDGKATIFSKLLAKALDYSSPEMGFYVVSLGDKEDGFYGLFTSVKDAYVLAARDSTLMQLELERATKTLIKNSKQKSNVLGKVMTKGQLADLYLAMHDADIELALTQAGKFNLKGGQVNNYITFDSTTFDKVRSVFSAAELEELDAVLNLYNVSWKDRLATAQKAVQGYVSLRQGTYYPKSVDESRMNANFSMDDNMRAMSMMIDASHQGIVKTRTNRGNSGVTIGDFESRARGYIQSLSQYANMSLATKEFNFAMNMRVSDGSGGKTTAMAELSNFLPEAKKNMFSFFQKSMGMAVGDKGRGNGLGSRLYSNYAVAVLGLNPSSTLKQFGSLPTATQITGWGKMAKSFFVSRGRTMVQDYRWLMENNGIFMDRMYGNGYVKANTLSNGLNAAQEVMTLPMKGTDTLSVLLEFRAAQVYDHDINGTAYGSEANLNNASNMLTDIILQTQSNSNSIAMSRLRSGELGSLQRALFGVFASDSQNKFTLFAEEVFANAYSREIIKNGRVQKIIDEGSARDFDAEISNLDSQLSTADATKADMDSLRAKRQAIADEKAQFEAAKKIMASAKANVAKAPKYYAKLASHLLASGMLVTAVSAFVRKYLYGMDDDTFDSASNAIYTTLINSFVDWIPVVGTIYDTIMNDYDVSVFSLDAVIDFGTAAIDFFEAIGSGDSDEIWSNGAQLGTQMAMLLGIPAGNIRKMVNGALTTFNPELAVQAESFYYNVSISSQISSMNEAIADGDTAKAAAYLNAIATERVGALASSVQSEMVRLMEEGYSLTPSELATTYTDADGKEVTISYTNQQKMKTYYSGANSDVKKLLNLSVYKSMTDAQKAKAIKAIYSAYREMAYSKVVEDYSPSSIKSALLADSASNSAFLIGAASVARSLEATDDKTRKEVILEYVNSLSCTKGDRYIILSMVGYSVDEATLKQALKDRGLSNSEINEWID